MAASRLKPFLLEIDPDIEEWEAEIEEGFPRVPHGLTPKATLLADKVRIGLIRGVCCNRYFKAYKEYRRRKAFGAIMLLDSPVDILNNLGNNFTDYVEDAKEYPGCYATSGSRYMSEGEYVIHVDCILDLAKKSFRKKVISEKTEENLV